MVTKLFSNRCAAVLAGAITITFVAGWPGDAYAQFGEGVGRGITGVGTAKVQLTATHARLMVTLKATAGDMKSATQRLRERKAKAMELLAQMKAIESSVKTVRTSMGDDASEMGGGAMRQMAMMGGFGGEGGGMPAMPQMVSVKSVLIADWKLPAGDAELMLLFSERLQAKVSELDLTGEKDQAEMTPEQAEMMAEMASEMSMYMSEREGAPLRVVFYAVPTAEQLAEARAAAIASAKAEAAAIALAAGVGLGKLAGIMESPADGVMTRIYSGMYGQDREVPAGEGEVISPQPDDLVRQVSVILSYDIE